MKRKRNLNTFVLRMLRKVGMLCKKPTETKQRLRVSHTIYPDNRVSPIDAERAVWVENKKRALKDCMFDTSTNTCKCGVGSIDMFAINGCKK